MTTKRKDPGFRRGGQGVFACSDCGRSTRSTLETGDSPLCPDYYELEGIRNGHYDGCHEETPEPTCPICNGNDEKNETPTTSKETATVTKTAKYPTLNPANLVIIGLDTADDDTHPLYDERIKLPLDEDKVQNLMVYGVLQAVTVTSKNEVVLGRQRTRGLREANARFAKFTARQKKEWLEQYPGHPMSWEIPYVVKDLDEKTAFGAMISENEVRTKDNPVVAARKMETMLNLAVADAMGAGLDEKKAWARAWKEVAVAFGCSPAKVKQYQQLLGLAPEVLTRVEAGDLAVYEVMGLRELNPEAQARAANQKAENKKAGIKDQVDGDESRILKPTKSAVRGVAQYLSSLKTVPGGTVQLALLWASAEISEAAAAEDKTFREAIASTRKGK